MNYALVGIVLILSLTVVSAKTLFETSFADLGIDTFSAQGARVTECMDFEVPVDENLLVPGNYPVLSVHAGFFPVESRDANITLYAANDENGVSQNPAAFQNNFFRFDIDQSALLDSNVLSLCAATSDSTTRIVITDSTVFGVYQKPVFGPEDFVKLIPSGSPRVGEEFEVTVELHNSGSEAVDVNLFYKKPFIDFDAVLFVKGDTEYLGEVAPGQTVSFTYTAKAIRSGMITMNAAVVSYTNIFGEEELRVSNYPLIRIRDPDVSVRAIVLNKSTQKELFAFESVPMEILVQNEGLSDLFNISVVLKQDENLFFEPTEVAAIPVLRPGETKTIPFSVSARGVGRHKVECRVFYRDTNLHETPCSPTSLLVQEKRFPTEVVAGSVLALAAVLVYLFYHFRKTT